MSYRNKNTIEKASIYGRIEELMGVELRSLGVFRIGIGALLLIDLVNRAAALVAHYTDAGVAPRSLVVEYGEQPWFFSFHMLSGEPGLQVVLFIVAGICAFNLAIGYYSRFFCFLSWILTLSLHVRNPFINNLGDWLLVDLLFWGMFLPLGARFSVDAVIGPGQQALPKRALSIASLGILLQIGFMYFFSVMDKFTPAWRVEGTAIEMALNLERIVSSTGQHLLDLPADVLKILTFATLYLERWGPILVFVPFFIGPVRSFVAGIFMGFHLMLAIFFELGIFPYLCIVAWVLYLPEWFWERTAFYSSTVRESTKEVWKRIPELIKRVFHKRMKSIRLLPSGAETIISVCALFAMLSSGLLYGGVMGEAYYDMVYKHIEPVVNTLNMKQRWDMFSPQPPKNDGWFVVAAYTKEGSVYNVLYPERRVRWDRPADLSATYKNQRWRKYMEWVMNREGPFAVSYGKYNAMVFSQKKIDSGELDHISVYYMEEILLSDLTTSSVVRNELIRVH